MDKEITLRNLHYLPIILCIMVSTTFISTYVIAVFLGHVEPGFPYISDTATSAPESCIFAQSINMTAILMCFVMYIRYSQVKGLSSAFTLNISLTKYNYWSLILGLLSTLGLSLVANFQETSVFIVHIIGAGLCFGCGTLYFWTQALCSYYLHPINCSLELAHIRLALSVFSGVCFLIILVTGGMAYSAYKGTNPRKWHKEDGGWELHTCSTVTEWICASAFCFYILSFTHEFRGIELTRFMVIQKDGSLRTDARNLTSESQSTENSPDLLPTVI